mgnify:CR=1 FL=1
MTIKNGDMPAMPQDRGIWVDGIGECPTLATGITKREMMAMAAMQGILSNGNGVIQSSPMSGWSWCNSDEHMLAQVSVLCADALLAELERTK